MSTIKPFSVSCYQTSFLSPAASPSSRMWDQVSENLKKVARCLYMLGVSTLVAPVGVGYHLGQGVVQKIQSYCTNEQQTAQVLSDRAWRHFDAAEKDLCASVRGGLTSYIALTIMYLAAQVFRIGVLSNNLALTVAGAGFCWIGHRLTDDTHLPKAWKSLEDVKHVVEQDRFHRIGVDFAAYWIIALHIGRHSK